MRNFALGVALVGCTLVVAANAIFGFRTSDNMLDATVAAAIFAFISFVGLAGHALAVHLWAVSRGCSLFIGVIAAGTMIVSLTNSLGFVVLRGEAARTTATAEQVAITDARATLDRLLTQRAVLPTYKPATDDQVAAARNAAATAKLAREAECDKRGSNCRAREVDEIAANTAVVAIEGDRATTKVAEDLDAKIAAAQERLSGLGVRTESNPFGAALAALAAFIRLPDADANTAYTLQQLLIATFLELAIVGAFIASEVLSRVRVVQTVAQPTPVEPVQPEADQLVQAVVQPTQIEPVQAQPEPLAIEGPNVVKMPTREQLKLVVDYATQRLEIGKSATIADLQADFERWAGTDAAMDADTFIACLNRMCERMEWKMAQGRVRGVSLKTGT